MLVTVFCAPRDRPETTFVLDVSPDLKLRDFVGLCVPESGIPADEIQITYAEQPLKDPTRALGTYGVKDGDVVVLRQTDRRPPPTQPAFPGLPRIDFRSISVPGTSSSVSPRSATRPQPPVSLGQQPLPRPPQPSAPVAFRGTSPQGLDDPALLQQMLLTNPHELSLLKERNPPLAEALLSGDLERFTKVLQEQQQDRAKREQERIRLLTADPFDLEAQAKIEEDIRQHNVEENMNIAMEEAPESFGQVVMLYINCKVNGHPVKAFVDSGAQMTIMSQACAERCNIMRLVDRRWAGIAKGVGTQKIIGRVHLAQVQIEGDFLPCSFSILEDQPMDMLLGLDMLKRHQCSIDLKKNVLLIGTTGTETRFLSEAELPECARLAYGAEGREDVRPDELADRELAEALQRSIQESDPAAGQTTSQEPPPFTLPRTLGQTPSSTSALQNPPPQHPQMLDRSQSAPATVRQASASGLLQPSASATNVIAPPHPAGPDPTPPPPLVAPSTEVLGTSFAAEATTQAPDPDVEVELGAAGGGSESEDLKNTALPGSPTQAMEQEAVEPDAAEGVEVCHSDPTQSDPVEMEFPVDSQDAASSERDQPERERPPCSDSIPSLAAALMELHELLVSNNQAHAASCSSSQPVKQETGQDAPDTPGPTVAPGAESRDAKANRFAAASDEGPSDCVALDPSEPESGGPTENREGQRPAQCPESSMDRTTQEHDEVEKTSLIQADPEAPSASVGELELKEAADGCQDGATDNPGPQTERASLRPSAVTTEVSDPPVPEVLQLSSPDPSVSSQPPFIDHFPAEHIRRIQAAGFSASEAAEALQRAHGVVELALLTLLARSITVPT
ncbi:protein DDI1 homolog 2 isoform X1 [Takifugu flavidus]|uniref:protein DDI1 homolog 2 isoform X1 n=1 Tax=Takifugu flavidus TaxID=433684 RepID=UPI00254485AB|nr:protein DDI1 homolog 2 isoform X1 [Takifugu flavidus]XP_056886126.1 protein DDI1 homolog 2 isoform X1 [Takifugu flavidus]